MNDTVRIVAHTFTLPNGDTITVEASCSKTSRERAIFYVKTKAAQWNDANHDAIYFLSPNALQVKADAKREGRWGWHVGVSAGFQVLMCRRGEHAFMEAS